MRRREGRMIGVGSLAGGSERRSEAEILRRIRRRPRRRISLLILVGLAIAGLSALYLFADPLGALWRAETESKEKASELAETRQALALAHRAIDTASRDRSAALADLATVTQAKTVEQEALVSERERAERAERDLAWAHNELEVLKADRTRAPPSRTAAERLKRDLMAARREVEALKAEGAQALAASRDASQSTQATAVEQQKALSQEREQAERLKHDLAAARTEIEALKAERAQAVAASRDAVRAAEAKGVEQQEALGWERAKAERLNREVETARSGIEALKDERARALAASAEAARTAETKAAEQQEALVRERAEAERLNRDLAATRSEIEGLRTAGARALAVSAEAAAQANAAEREAALSRGEAERLNRDLATARREIQALKAESARTLEASAEAIQPNQRVEVQSSSAEQAQGASPPGSDIDSAATGSTAMSLNERALLARATSLLKGGDISGARLILERALQAGSSRAAFQLAETYDPRQLSRWRAFGVRGDWDRAQALYLKAQRGGIKEANERIGPPQ